MMNKRTFAPNGECRARGSPYAAQGGNCTTKDLGEPLPRIRGEKLMPLCLTNYLLLYKNVYIMSPIEHYFQNLNKGGKYMNLGSNFNHRVTLRLNDEQYSFLISVSEMLGVSPSDYLRMSVNTGMVAMKNTTYSETMQKGMVGTHENVKTDSNDIV